MRPVCGLLLLLSELQLCHCGQISARWVLYNKLKLTWNAASHFCHQQGGFLPTPRTNHSQKVLNSAEDFFMSHDAQEFWLGLFAPNPGQQTFLWERHCKPLGDGDTAPWAAGEPGDLQTHFCTGLYQGEWKTMGCGSQYPVVCQFPGSCSFQVFPHLGIFHGQRYTLTSTPTLEKCQQSCLGTRYEGMECVAVMYSGEQTPFGTYKNCLLRFHTSLLEASDVTWNWQSDVSDSVNITTALRTCLSVNLTTATTTTTNTVAPGDTPTANDTPQPFACDQHTSTVESTPQITVGTSTVEATPQITVEASTVEATPQITVGTSTVEATPQITVETSTVEATPQITVGTSTVEATPQITVETSTVEATPQITVGTSTIESTPQITGETSTVQLAHETTAMSTAETLPVVSTPPTTTETSTVMSTPPTTAEPPRVTSTQWSGTSVPKPGPATSTSGPVNTPTAASAKGRLKLCPCRCRKGRSPPTGAGVELPPVIAPKDTRRYQRRLESTWTEWSAPSGLITSSMLSVIAALFVAIVVSDVRAMWRHFRGRLHQ